MYEAFIDPLQKVIKRLVALTLIFLINSMSYNWAFRQYDALSKKEKYLLMFFSNYDITKGVGK